MKRNREAFLSLGIVIGLLVTLAPGIWAHTEGSPFVTNLYAGNPKPGKPPVIAGTVQVWNDINYLYVKYQLTEEWQLVSTHLHIATALELIPQTKFGNPKVGTFEYYGPVPYDPGTQADTFQIDRTWPIGTTLAIAAHAVVRTASPSGYVGDVCSLASNLPSSVFVSLVYPGASGMSYFDVIITEDTILNGSHLGWCVDTDRGTGAYPQFASVYLPYNCPPYMLPDGIIEFDENLDLVNWLINQGFVGQLSPTPGLGAYNRSDLQRAIWELVEDNPLGDINLPGPFSQDRVNEMLAAARANGEGFVPTCGQKVTIILFPLEGQTIFMEFPIPCTPVYRDETAWAGDGDDVLRTFPGSSWALYFQYVIQ